MVNRYYVIDTGRNMSHFVKLIEEKLLSEKAHYVIYLTDQDDYIGIEEVTEDGFLDHYRIANAKNN